MEIEFKDSFKKSYKKRFRGNKNLEKIIKNRIILFIINHQNPQLRTHALQGRKKGLYSFSVTDDIRIIYLKQGNKVLFLDVGTHNQVY